MATLIPAIGSRFAQMTSGEKRLARRLQEKLDDDYLIWYDVAVGKEALHPDFMILHRERGLLVLQVKDWTLSQIRGGDRDNVQIATGAGVRPVASPVGQARKYAQSIVKLLERDAHLTMFNGKLLFPWGYGAVLSNITRQQFEASRLDALLDPSKILCSDEIADGVEATAFKERLGQLIPFALRVVLRPEQIDRVRWHLFPEFRIPAFAPVPLRGKQQAVPPRVLDIQQERLVRDWGEGHRVVHGVAGSGKSMILCHRAERLAAVCDGPILVLCHHQALAEQIREVMSARGVADKVEVRTFYDWCRLQAPGATAVSDAGAAERAVDAVERGQIGWGQYDAVLVDEAQDFEPSWLRVASRMVNPDTDQLFVAFDAAQCRLRQEPISLAAAGIAVRGRTSRLRTNYRNTQEVFQLAVDTAQEVLQAVDAGVDGVPRLAPKAGGLHGPAPEIAQLPDLAAEARFVAKRLQETHKNGVAWTEMAVIHCGDANGLARVAEALLSLGVPLQGDGAGVRLLALSECHGLEFDLVALVGLGELRDDEEHREQDIRMVYTAMTRTKRTLIICGH